MKKKRIKKCARMAARFFIRYGCLPYGLAGGLMDTRVSDLVLFNKELGRYSPHALFLLLHGEPHEGYDEHGADDKHPGAGPIHSGGMFQ